MGWSSRHHRIDGGWCAWTFVGGWRWDGRHVGTAMKGMRSMGRGERSRLWRGRGVFGASWHGDSVLDWLINRLALDLFAGMYNYSINASAISISSGLLRDE